MSVEQGILVDKSGHIFYHEVRLTDIECTLKYDTH